MFDQTVKTDLRIYIWKIVNGQDDYTTGCLLDYFHFKKNYAMTAIL